MGTIDPYDFKDKYPKKIKNFLGELRLGAINMADRLQRPMPYMVLSPSWCIMCKSNVETPCHLFMQVHLVFVFGLP